MYFPLVAVFLGVVAIRYGLRSLNLRYLKTHGNDVPPEFAGLIEPERLRTISAYTFENSRVGLVESLLGNVILVLFFFCGLLGVYDRWIASLSGSFLGAGLLFVLILLYAETFLDIPFSLFRTFRIENRYGFNTMTGRLWLVDLLKTAALATVLGAVVVLGALALVHWSPLRWWLWVWGFLLLVGILLQYLSPALIEPLFFKFEPLRIEGMEERIKTLLAQAGLRVSRVFQVDASRRSRHSNAYFTGIGRVKRIVLFDTLLTQLSEDEILAVLAHEGGHWKKRHVLKGIVLSQVLSFCGLFLAFRLIRWGGLPGLIGLANASFYARIAITGFLGSLVLFPLTPLFSMLSRRHEREADRFAVDLTGRPDTLASGLAKLSRENLANLHPHPWYAKFYYSHPPVVERIRTLRGGAGDRETRDETKKDEPGFSR